MFKNILRTFVAEITSQKIRRSYKNRYKKKSVVHI